MENEKTEVATQIDALIENAQVAFEQYMKMTQEEVDRITQAMTFAAINNHMNLAKFAVEETKRGIVEDKAIKNLFSAEYICNSIKKLRTVGIMQKNDAEGIIEVAEPMGIVAGIVPLTNPTSTTIFKSIICAKTRNPIIFAFHPSAQKCSVEAARILREAAIKAGAPQNCMQWIEFPSLDATTALMKHPGTAIILATGGAGLVQAAYSAGKPALGVGPGNTPCYIHKDANLPQACTDIMLSKTFDNGMVCASEQAVIVDKSIAKKFEQYMKDHNCHFLTAEETKKLTEVVITSCKKGTASCAAGQGISVNAACVGKPATHIAELAGIKVHPNTKILIAQLSEPTLENPLSIETLMPVLAYFIVDNEEQGFDYAKKMLELGGLGHTAVIHSENENICIRYGNQMQAGRVIINSPASQGAIGGLYNTLIPSLTLGCGSYGRNSTITNVSSVNLLNIKRIAKRRINMQWFKIPPQIYFENNSVQYLEKMPNISRAFIVTDRTIKDLGYISKILYYLRKREAGYVNCEIFSDVEPDPSVETIMRGVAEMNRFKPDVIIAVGGGSPIDAAKGMWLFYEHPNINFEDLRLKFMDIHKRAYSFPNLGQKAKFVAIPTTSGTGSEVTAFTVITDKKNGNIKYPLADYELTPDVAIVDPQFVESMPKSVAADTGLDVLTHAIEAYVSVMASDYTDGLALKSIDIVFKYLLRSFTNEKDTEAREKMHNASAIAGMAFTNSFLGINHSMAHKLGGEFNIPHGRANALLLPYVITYNAQKPDKFASFPKYNQHIADTRYAEIAHHLHLGGKTTDDSIARLIKAIQTLMKKLKMPTSIKECGIDETEFMNKVSMMAEHAFEDQCTGTNPRFPLIKDMEEIYKKAYFGEDL